MRACLLSGLLTSATIPCVVCTFVCAECKCLHLCIKPTTQRGATRTDTRTDLYIKAFALPFSQLGGKVVCTASARVDLRACVQAFSFAAHCKHTYTCTHAHVYTHAPRTHVRTRTRTRTSRTHTRTSMQARAHSTTTPSLRAVQNAQRSQLRCPSCHQ